MKLLDKILGPSYNIKILRRKIRSGKQDKTILDTAAIVEDDETGQKKIRFKSDKKEIPKPSNTNFDRLETSGWFYSGQVDFIEIEEDGEQASVIDFEYSNDEKSLIAERAEKTHIFQAHRNFLNKKTIEAWSKDDNYQLMIAGYLTVLALVTIAALYFVVNGLEDSIVDGVVQGVQAAQGSADAAT